MASKLSFIGIEILPSGIKWVLLDSKKRIEKIGFEKGSDDLQNSIQQAVNVIKTQVKIPSKSLKIAVSLPVQSLVVKKTLVPEGMPSSSEYVRWELANYLGEDDLSDFVLKWQSEDVQQSEVKVIAHAVAVRKSEMDKHVQTLQTAELPAHIIDVDAFVAMNTLELLGEKHPKAFVVRVEKEGLLWVGVEEGRLQSVQLTPGPTDFSAEEMSLLTMRLQSQLNELAKGQKVPFYICGHLVSELEKAKFETSQDVRFLNPILYTEKSDKKLVISESLGINCAFAYTLALRAFEDFAGAGVTL